MTLNLMENRDLLKEQLSQWTWETGISSFINSSFLLLTGFVTCKDLQADIQGSQESFRDYYRRETSH